MSNSLLAVFLAKAKSIGGPLVALALLGAAGGWATRGLAEDQQDLAEMVTRLDSAVVRRYEFEKVVMRLEAVAARQDSTNALLKRFICREQPTICP